MKQPLAIWGIGSNARIITASIIALMAATMTPWLTNTVLALGTNIPQTEIITDYLVAVIVAVVLWLLLGLVPASKNNVQALRRIWIVKCFIMLGFMLLYEANYRLDAYSYYDRATQSTFDTNSLIYGAGTAYISGLTWLFNRMLFDSYHALKVVYGFVGLVAVYLYYRAAVSYMGKERIGLFYALALFPSLLFWGSILGKDPIVLFGFAVYSYGVVNYFTTGRPFYGLYALAGVVLTGAIRLWLPLIMLVPMMAVAIVGLKGTWQKLLACMVVLVTLYYFQAMFLDSLRIATFQDALNAADRTVTNMATGGSANKIGTALTSPTSALKFLPLGIFSALLRPLPGELMTPFGMLASLENMYLLVLFVLAFSRMKLRDLKEPVLLWAVTLVLVWCCFYAFISYGNMGAAMRFKVMILPVLLLTLWRGVYNIKRTDTVVNN